jgi:hypothetical protein
MRRTAYLFAASLIAGPAAGQQGAVPGIAKGDNVLVAIYPTFASARMTGISKQNLNLDFNVRRGEAGFEVLDNNNTWRRDWRAVGLPASRTFEVKSIKMVSGDNNTKRIEVRLDAGSWQYRVYAPEGQGAAIAEVVVRAVYGDSLFRMAYRAIAPRVFKGPLEVFPEADRMALLAFAHVTAGGTDLSTEVFKEINYVAVHLPDAEGTWNDLRVTRSERVGRLVEKQLPLLKAFAKSVSRHEGFGGLKLVQGSSHGAAPDYRNTSTDQVEVYFPLEILLKYANSDITSQQLLDASYVLVDGERVAVDLSKL